MVSSRDFPEPHPSYHRAHALVYRRFGPLPPVRASARCAETACDTRMTCAMATRWPDHGRPGQSPIAIGDWPGTYRGRGDLAKLRRRVRWLTPPWAGVRLTVVPQLDEQREYECGPQSWLKLTCWPNKVCKRRRFWD